MEHPWCSVNDNNIHIQLRYNGYAGNNIATVSYSSSTNDITNPIITLSDNVEVRFSIDTFA